MTAREEVWLTAELGVGKSVALMFYCTSVLLFVVCLTLWFFFLFYVLFTSMIPSHLGHST